MYKWGNKKYFVTPKDKRILKSTGSSIKDFEDVSGCAFVDNRDCGFSVKLRMTKKDKKKKNGFPLSQE